MMKYRIVHRSLKYLYPFSTSFIRQPFLYGLTVSIWAVMVFAAPALAQSSDSSVVAYRTFYSEALKQEKRFAVYLPPGYASSKQDYPVLYFLHGLFESEQRWEQRGARAIVDSLITAGAIRPMIIAIPEGDNSFWVNSVDGTAPYEDYILKDFMPFIEKTYRIRVSRAFRVISGVSMGGYGALELAMRHPDLFSAASAHSAILLPAPIHELPPQLRQSFQSQFFEATFGNPVDEAYWSRYNPIDLAQSAGGLNRVAWYFDCGTEDRFEFFRGATKLHEILESTGVPHEYHLFPGGHGWEYLRTTLHRSLIFHSQHFGS